MSGLLAERSTVTGVHNTRSAIHVTSSMTSLDTSKICTKIPDTCWTSCVPRTSSFQWSMPSQIALHCLKRERNTMPPYRTTSSRNWFSYIRPTTNCSATTIVGRVLIVRLNCCRPIVFRHLALMLRCQWPPVCPSLRLSVCDGSALAHYS